MLISKSSSLDQLDPGLSSRPSRFDRKYLFPLPSAEERILYCNYWREKLKTKPSIKFPKKLCVAIAGITQEFSFAYLKEAFVATLLAIAGHRSEDEGEGGGNDEGGDLDDYEIWREMKKQVKALREDMDTHNNQTLWANQVTGVHSWKEFDQPMRAVQDATAKKADYPKLSLRENGRRGARFPLNPRLIGSVVGGDDKGTPLMTDGGMFVDSSFGVDGLTL